MKKVLTMVLVMLSLNSFAGTGDTGSADANVAKCKIASSTLPLEVANQFYDSRKDATNSLQKDAVEAKAYCEGLVSAKGWHNQSYAGYDECEILSTDIEKRVSDRKKYSVNIDGSTDTELFKIPGLRSTSYVNHIVVRAVKYATTPCQY